MVFLSWGIGFSRLLLGSIIECSSFLFIEFQAGLLLAHHFVLQHLSSWSISGGTSTKTWVCADHWVFYFLKYFRENIKKTYNILWIIDNKVHASIVYSRLYRKLRRLFWIFKGFQSDLLKTKFQKLNDWLEKNLWLE